MGNIHLLAPRSDFTVEEALAYARNKLEAGELTEVLMIGVDNQDHLLIFSSGMTRERANYLADQAKLQALSIL